MIEVKLEFIHLLLTPEVKMKKHNLVWLIWLFDCFCKKKKAVITHFLLIFTSSKIEKEVNNRKVGDK